MRDNEKLDTYRCGDAESGAVRTRAKTGGLKQVYATTILKNADSGLAAWTTLNKYHNRSIETAQVIEELIQWAKEMQEDAEMVDKLNLSVDEMAFYRALVENGGVSENGK